MLTDTFSGSTHQKCDETHPNCFNCTKSNRQCVYKAAQPPPPINTDNIFITNPESYELAIAQNKSPASSYFTAKAINGSNPRKTSATSSDSSSKTSTPGELESLSRDATSPHLFIQHSFPQNIASASSVRPSLEQYEQIHGNQPGYSNNFPVLATQSNYQLENAIPQSGLLECQSFPGYYASQTIPINSIIPPTSHPNWHYQSQQLLKYYQDYTFRLVPSNPYSGFLWRDYILSLANKHSFLATAICTFASLHIDSNTQSFQASQLSLSLYNQALSECGAECVNVNIANLEAAYFASTLIWMCSYRLLKTVPYYLSPNDVQTTDIFSLLKGPISILNSIKNYIPESPLSKIKIGYNLSQLLEGPVPVYYSTLILDDLILLCHRLPVISDFDFNQLVTLIRRTPSNAPPTIYSDDPSVPVYLQSLDILCHCVQKSIFHNDITKLHDWPQNITPEFLHLLRDYARNPFALIILAHYFAFLMFATHPSIFWLHDRIFYEINKIQSLLPGSWIRFMNWPNMVSENARVHLQVKNEPMGLEALKQMVLYKLV